MPVGYIADMIKPKAPNSLTKPFLIQLDEGTDEAVEGERRLRGLKSRSETIRVLLAEGLHRAKVRRGKGQPVELPK